MQPDIHPNYQFVVFRDVSCGFTFLTRSTIKTHNAEKIELNGETYPVISVDVSSESHPFYTGNQKIMDTAGRVDRFYRKYGFAKPEGE